MLCDGTCALAKEIISFIRCVSLSKRGLYSEKPTATPIPELCDVEKLKKVSGRGVESEHLGTEAFEENVAAKNCKSRFTARNKRATAMFFKLLEVLDCSAIHGFRLRLQICNFPCPVQIADGYYCRA